MKSRYFASLSILAVEAMSVPAHAGRPIPPDQAELGRDGKGDPCSSTRDRKSVV